MIKIGIPKSLMYYKYAPLWKTFFEGLGAEVVVSPVTNKSILDQGVKLVVDEVCLPVKVYFGHVNYLKDKVDYIFAPRIVSVVKKEFTCPKFMGIPDILIPNIKGLPKLIAPNIDLNKKDKALFKQIWEVGKIITKNPLKIASAWQKALKAMKDHEKIFLTGKIPSSIMKIEGQKKSEGLNVVVLGHEYIIYDSFLSMNLLHKVQDLHFNVITPQMLDESIINKEVEIIPKRIFWTFSKNLLGNAFYYSKQKDVAGIILVSAFGCGPDAMTNSMIAHFQKNFQNKPLLLLTIDEHSGEAGINTRLEAFADLLRRKVG